MREHFQQEPLQYPVKEGKKGGNIFDPQKTRYYPRQEKKPHHDNLVVCRKKFNF